MRSLSPSQESLPACRSQGDLAYADAGTSARLRPCRDAETAQVSAVLAPRPPGPAEGADRIMAWDNVISVPSFRGTQAAFLGLLLAGAQGHGHWSQGRACPPPHSIQGAIGTWGA